MRMQDLACSLLLLAGCRAVERDHVKTPADDGSRPVLEVLGVEPVEGGHRVHVRLDNPTRSSWCLHSVGGDPQVHVQLPSDEDPGWRDELNYGFCGTDIVWMELAPGASVESVEFSATRLPRIRLGLWLVEGAMQPRGGYHFLWPPMNQPWVWIHTAPIELAER